MLILQQKSTDRSIERKKHSFEEKKTMNNAVFQSRYFKSGIIKEVL